MNRTKSHVLYTCKQFIHSCGRMVSRKEKEKTLDQRQRKKEYITTSANTQQKVRKSQSEQEQDSYSEKLCSAHPVFSFCPRNQEQRREAVFTPSVEYLQSFQCLFSNRLTVLKDSCYFSPASFLSSFSHRLRGPFVDQTPCVKLYCQILNKSQGGGQPGLQDIAALLPAVLLGRYATDEVVRPQGRA